MDGQVELRDEPVGEGRAAEAGQSHRLRGAADLDARPRRQVDRAEWLRVIGQLGGIEQGRQQLRAAVAANTLTMELNTPATRDDTVDAASSPAGPVSTESVKSS